MSDELKPCPFCGGAASLEVQFGREWWVQCKDLGCSATDGGIYSTQLEATTRWNSRAQVSPPADESVQMDARRLDWLEKNRETVYLCSHQDRVPCTDGFRRYELRYVFDGWAVRTDDEPKPTPRAAIDAAMSLAAMAKGD